MNSKSVINGIIIAAIGIAIAVIISFFTGCTPQQPYQQPAVVYQQPVAVQPVVVAPVYGMGYGHRHTTVIQHTTIVRPPAVVYRAPATVYRSAPTYRSSYGGGRASFRSGRR